MAMVPTIHSFLRRMRSMWWPMVFAFKPWFHWKYSSVVIPTLWVTAIAMVQFGITFDAPDEIGTFSLLAYLFFVATWLYACGIFITSDWLQNVVREIQSAATEGRYTALTRFCLYIATPFLAITLFLSPASYLRIEVSNSIGLVRSVVYWLRQTTRQFTANLSKAHKG